MLCVSIAQTNPVLAQVDMHNAAESCDLIELRLDKFEQAPDMKELLGSRPKPVIVSCRRPKDGGNWNGSEPARLALLRQAILDGVDYAEIEVDVADQIPRYGPTKRVVSYTNPSESPEDLEKIYQSCTRMDPDVVKITVPTRSAEDAWPLIKIIATGKTPTVAVGWGRAGITLNVLGRRYKAPWTYAALEKGMEAYPGMATVAELQNTYDLPHIDSKTPLLGVSGMFDEHRTAIEMLNHGMARLGARTRCLPIQIADVHSFRKIVQAIRLTGVLVDDRRRAQIVEVTTDPEEAVRTAGAADFVVPKEDQWVGYNIVSRVVPKVIEETLTEHYGSPQSLEGRTVIVVGCGATGRSIAHAIRRRKAIITLADPSVERAKALAGEMGVRFVAPSQVYTTISDGLILCLDDADPKPGKAAIDIPKNCARSGMFAVDLTDIPNQTPFLQEVRVQGGITIRPIDVLCRIVQTVLKAAVGKTVSREELLKPFTDDERARFEARESSPAF